MTPVDPSLDEKRPMCTGTGTGVVFTCPNTLRNTLVYHNAASGDLATSPGINTIPSNDCPEVYKSENKKGIKQHKHDVMYVRESNAFFIHLREQGHQLKWKDVNLINKSTDSYERKQLKLC